MEMEPNKQHLKNSAIRELWRRGNLYYKLDETQKGLYNAFYNSNHKITTWLLSRRQGKSFLLCILALEQCLKQPNSIVKFVSPTKRQMEMNVRPLLNKIFEDCPGELKPEFRKQESIYFFPSTNSELQLAGTDGGHAERLRGGDSHLFFVDEAGSCSDLENVIKSILLPTTLITKGRGIIASTPPKESDHDFLKYIEDAEKRGSLTIKTIDDNPRIGQSEKEELIAELGGPNSEETLRELYCKIIKDSTKCVIPEFDDALEKEIVKEWKRPAYFDAYEGMDTGGKDFTVVLYGYFDWLNQKIIIEDETVIDFQNKDVTIERLTSEINKKEWELWKSPITGEYKGPLLRVSDVDYILINEIRRQSQKMFPQEEVINFQLAKKDDAAAAIAQVRMLIQNQKIIIHPRCKTLIRHLRHAKWDKNKTKFARSVDDSHYDALEALKYLVRHVYFSKNPYPANYNVNMQDLFIKDQTKFNENNNSQVNVYQKLFNWKSPKKRY